jgi:hypothetical protein
VWVVRVEDCVVSGPRAVRTVKMCVLPVAFPLSPCFLPSSRPSLRPFLPRMVVYF